MKLAFSIKRKLRLAIIMAALMLFIILFSLIESYNITRISNSFKSIYEDRLIPATDLYHIADKIYDRNHRLLLFLHTETIGLAELQDNLIRTDQEIDSRLIKYQKTYLVTAESAHLSTLKDKLGAFRRDEQLLLNAAIKDKQTAASLYFNKTLPLFNELRNQLAKLTELQNEVGKELLKDSVSIASDSSFISTLQLISAIVLGLMIIVLVMTSKEVVIKPGDFNMN